MPVTKVEHWFRNDNSFAIPSDDIWFKLKEVLGLNTDIFDAQIMEFEYRDGVYESKQRVYSEEGKSPTLTASNKDQYIETKPVKAYDIPREILKDNERQRRVYDPKGKSPTILGRSDSPKITTPKQVGIAVDIKGHDQIKRVYSPDGKSPTVTTCGGGHREPKVVTGGAFRGRAYDKDGKRIDRDGSSVANKTKQMLELRRDNKSNAITTVGKDSVAVFSKERIAKLKETMKENPQPSTNGIIQLNNPTFSSNRVYSPDGKSPTLLAGNKGGGKEPVKINDDLTWRKLTPLECERLQTVPDNYTNHVSNTQRYKMLGNGWTVDVICHIFKNME
jgi:site-specific DNA-cytosine methylase